MMRNIRLSVIIVILSTLIFCKTSYNVNAINLISDLATNNIMNVNNGASEFYNYSIEEFLAGEVRGHDLTKLILTFLLGAVIFTAIGCFILSLYYKNIRSKNHEIENFNELRKTFIDSTDNLIYLKDENLRYIFINKALEDFLRIDESKAVGRDDIELADPEFADIQRHTDLQVLEKMTKVTDEVRWKDKILQLKKFPVKLLNNHYGVGAYIQDITEDYLNRQKLQELNSELNKTNTLLMAILESSPDIIVFALDTNYCYLSFNRKHKETMKEIWGKDIEIGMSIFEVISCEDDRIKAKENFDKALSGENFSLVEDYGDEKLLRPIWQNYYAPIVNDNGEKIGLTCFVLNITERVRAEQEVIYLSYHDELTGLYNRRFFEAELRRLDTERNLPISIIVADMNGLKLANDIFGHSVGDILLQRSADVLRSVCRKDEIIARVGGDEFTILLPKTQKEDAEKVIDRIKEELSKVRVKAIYGSMSMGCDTKTSVHEDIFQVLNSAESRMYAVKVMDCDRVKRSTMRTIIEDLYRSNLAQEKHTQNVRRISEQIGRSMNLPEPEIKKLKEAAYFHDIGKIALDENILKDAEFLTEEEQKEMKQHPVLGYRILHSFDETLDLAEAVLAHHERWDGSGYPKGLKGEEIPKLARIIAVVESYEELITGANPMSKEEAVKELKKQAGIKFDPEVVDTFIKLVHEGI